MSDSAASRLAAVQRVLRLTGVAFPRGVLGGEATALAQTLATDARPEDLSARLDAVAVAHWGELHAAIGAAIARAASRADPSEREAFELAAAMAEMDDPGNPLARALALRAGTELAAAYARAQLRLAPLEEVLADTDHDAAIALGRAAGETVVDLLELDPDDFAAEIADYVDDASDTSVATLARATGDVEVRTWARDALAALSAGGPATRTALDALTDGPPPDDAAEDVLWVGTILALVAQGLESAAIEQDGPPPGEPDAGPSGTTQNT